jgi:hypothetical protein
MDPHVVPFEESLPRDAELAAPHWSTFIAAIQETL